MHGRGRGEVDVDFLPLAASDCVNQLLIEEAEGNEGVTKCKENIEQWKST